MKWSVMPSPNGDYKIVTTYPCINGLSAAFTVATVHTPDEVEEGYTDGVFNWLTAEDNAKLIANAPNLRRFALELLQSLWKSGDVDGGFVPKKHHDDLCCSYPGDTWFELNRDIFP